MAKLALVRTLLMAGVVAGLASATGAQEWIVSSDDSWCQERSRREIVCEVRAVTLPATGRLEVDAAPNGGITVSGWDGNEVRVEARIRAQARTRDRAQELFDGVEVHAQGGQVSSSGPRSERDGGWSVSYRIEVPNSYDLSLESINGGLSVSGVDGSIELETKNGGLHLVDVRGDVQARTLNGGVSVELAGDRWQGGGLDVETKNGGVRLKVPEGYSADLVTGTVNGPLRVDFPLRVQGDLGQEIHTQLGSGGAPVRVRTTNGGVVLERSS